MEIPNLKFNHNLPTLELTFRNFNKKSINKPEVFIIVRDVKLFIFVCHFSCLTCSDGSATGCLTCPDFSTLTIEN